MRNPSLRWVEKKALALSITAASASFMVSPGAGAQEDQLEEITVTGSRITRSGMTTPTPVTILNVQELEKINPGKLIEALDQIPQFFGNFDQADSGGGARQPGGGVLNLRGAGNERTLVLLDGRRLTPSNRFGNVDVNIIPEQLLRSVETVTGGGSAGYGTDAVAGVVNFILDTEFTGLKLEVQGGGTDHTDGANQEYGLAFGVNLTDRLHIMGSGELFRQSAIDDQGALRDRSFFKQRARITNPDPNGPREIIRPFVSPTNFSNTGIINQPGSALDKLEFQPDGSVKPLDFSGVGQFSGGCNCQAEPFQSFGVDGDEQIFNGNDRSSAFFRLDYQLRENLNVYMEGIWANGEIRDRRESIALVSIWAPRIFADNPFLPPEVKQILEQEGLESFGFQIFTPAQDGEVIGDPVTILDNYFKQGTWGFEATIPGELLSLRDWQVSGYVSAGRNKVVTNSVNRLRADRIPLALDATTDAEGNPVCTVTLANPGVFDDCVPVNLFGGVANITPEMAAFIMNDSKLATQTSQQINGEILFTGEIWKGFGSAGPVLGAFGFNFRDQDFSQFTNDPSEKFPAMVDGTLFSDLGILPEGVTGVIPENLPNGIPGLRNVPRGFNGNSSSSSVLFTSVDDNKGSQSVQEMFGEVHIPLLSGRPGAEQLDLDMAGRYANYNKTGVVWAWKFGLSWQIVDSLRIRATNSRDIRAATLRERFDLVRGGTSVRDPENNNDVINTASASGGNANLGSEESDTFTVGMVFTPTFMEGLSMSADWYYIDIDGAIGQLSSQNVVDGCFTGDNSLCKFVIRDPVTNQIERVENLFINLGNQRISGIDTEISYNRDIRLFGGGPESISWRLLGTWLDENSIKNPGGPRDERAGQIAGGFSLPEFKVTTNVTYSNGPFSLFLQGRYIDSGILDRFATEGVTIDDNRVSSVFYTDLNLSFNGSGSVGDWEFFVNILNLADRDPPAAPGSIGRTGTNEFNTNLHDILGRRYTAGMRLNF